MSGLMVWYFCKKYIVRNGNNIKKSKNKSKLVFAYGKQTLAGSWLIFIRQKRMKFWEKLSGNDER